MSIDRNDKEQWRALAMQKEYEAREYELLGDHQSAVEARDMARMFRARLVELEGSK